MQRPTYTRSLRVAVIAAAWFLAPTLPSVSAGGSLRETIFYAVPVVCCLA
ncbi:MAG: hypothetical protein ABI564_08065 [Ideonella sp.]